ncbi:hypothetical protein [Candidatus Enterococcus huntleyi]|nr:hypothetical protein [Enterococcus sp. JM4C]
MDELEKGCLRKRHECEKRQMKKLAVEEMRAKKRPIEKGRETDDY